MRGLIQKNLLSSGIKIKHIIFLFAILMAVSFLAPIDSFIPMIAYSLLIFSPLIVILSVMNQTNNDNYKSEVILPVKKSEILIADYLTYFIVFLICIPIVGVFLYVNYRLGKTQLEAYEINLITVGIGMTILFGGILFPTIILFGQQNLKVISIASFIFTIIPIRIFMEILKHILGLDNVFDIYNYSELITLFIISCMIFYIFSCILSIIIFNKKEF